jgi:hypothetical protein
MVPPGWRYCAAQVKLAASSVLPEPLYLATRGNWHSGRLRVTAADASRRMAFRTTGA